MQRPIRSVFVALCAFVLFALVACGGGSSTVNLLDGSADGTVGPDGARPGDGGRRDGGALNDGGAGSLGVGGTVSGLLGTGLVLQDNGGDNLAVSGNGTFTFAKKLAKGASYSVTVQQQPMTPAQSCVVTKASGTLGATSVTSVVVTCTTGSFTIGGTVTGLTSEGGAGPGLVLQDNGSDVLAVSSDGAFTFPTPVASGAMFNVTVKGEPTSPLQTCTVSGGQGIVANANVTSVAVSCAPAMYTVGGTISGLQGSVTLDDGDGGTVTVTSNGSFAFPTPLSAGTSYTVSVDTQPSSPVQTCVVTNGTGSVTDSNATSVTVTCTTTMFTVGGTITGLATGASVVLQDSGGDPLTLTAPVAGGTFTFAATVASGATYTVSVLTQPGSPAQTCAVTGGTGSVTNANVTSVVVVCTTNSYTVGGTVTGLATGDKVVLQDNGGDTLPVSANGTFTFATSVVSGGTFAVTVLTQPGAPVQTCAVGGGTGTVGAGGVTSVAISCATNAYLVGGSIQGLAGTVVLQDNGGDNVSVSGTSTFSFPTPVASGGKYLVTVLTQPGSPAQTCVVSSGSGLVGTGAVTTVSILCTTNTYSVTATVQGLAVNESVTLLDNGANGLTVSSNSTATFTTQVASGQVYSVSVSANPAAPIAQTCVVASPTGTIGATSVNVVVTCTTNTYTISGTLNLLGANDSIALQDNATDTLTRTTNGAFVFATSIPSGATYAVTVLSQPASPIAQTCAVTGGSGPVTNANVTGVVVTCKTNTYSVSGTLTGLAANETVVLQDNNGNNLPVGSNGAFTFTTAVASGQPFSVTVFAQPGSPEFETCNVMGGTGTIGSAPVGTVVVTCAANTYMVGGTVSGLVGTVTLSNNGGPSLPVTANGTFAFPAVVTSGQAYSVAVVTSPTNPVTQTCTVTPGTGSGTVAGSNVTTVLVTCATNTYTIGGKLSGIGAGDTVTLLDNGGNSLPVTTNGAFQFTTLIASGGSYSVTAASPSSPISQTCTVTAGTGPVTSANISSVVVTCATNSFSVGGTVAQMAVGDSVTLVDNGGNPTTVTSNTSFTFTTAIASGAGYAVTVMTQPATPAQTCVVGNGAGTIGSGPVTNVSVTCSTNPGGEGATCTVDADCSQGWCSLLTGTCVAGQSCKGAQAYTTLGNDHAGIDSCGAGESTDLPVPTHQSCCRSLLLPAATDPMPMRMDKYEVTTGRVRQFVEAINALEGGYNLRAWAQAQVAGNTAAGQMLSAQMSPAVMAFLPTSSDPTTSLDLPAQLGATSMDANVPSEYQGCYMANGAYGAGDYWQPAATLSDFGSPARSFSQADYDIKSMNCGTYWIYAAFCAWDGGRLPTLAEVEAVWGPGQYPWTNKVGATAPFWPTPYPYTTVTVGMTTNYYANIPSPSVTHTVNWNNNSFNDNPGDFYFFPNLGTLTEEPAEVDNGTDLTPYIASPGRFVLDVTSVKSTSFAGTEGWQDLAANMLEITEESGTTGTDTFCDCGAYTAAEYTALPHCTCPSPGGMPPTKPGVVRATNLPTAPWVGGSWEGHETANPADPPYLSVHAYDEPLQTQYGKAGFRCVRPAPVP